VAREHRLLILYGRTRRQRIMDFDVSRRRRRRRRRRRAGVRDITFADLSSTNPFPKSPGGAGARRRVIDCGPRVAVAALSATTGRREYHSGQYSWWCTRDKTPPPSPSREFENDDVRVMFTIMYKVVSCDRLVFFRKQKKCMYVYIYI